MLAGKKRWRDDRNCGSNYPLPDGNVTECEPSTLSKCCCDDKEGYCIAGGYQDPRSCLLPGQIDYDAVRDWKYAGKKPELKNSITVYLHEMTYECE